MRIPPLARTPVDALRDAVRASPTLIDILVASGLTVLSLLTVVGGAGDIGSLSGLGLVFLFGQTIPLVICRRAPLLALVGTVGSTVGQALLAEGPLTSTLGSLIALFVVADRHERRVSTVAALATAVSFGAVIALRSPNALSGLVSTELAVLAAWVLGTWARERRTYVGTVEERARRLEADREDQARRAVADERDRIARELHDVVTHHVSVIVIQAGAALRALDRRPADARDAVAAIDSTARQALTDMRRMLGILGRPSDGGTGVVPVDDPLAPMPGLDRLGDLFEQCRAAGLPVELSIMGARRPLDPGVELSAYRIIQEALTNTLKHAAGARARVTLRYEPAALTVIVEDEGGSGHPAIAPHGGPGHGLIGMRERAALFGGTLEAGAVPGGFRVTARLPVGASVPAGAPA